MHETALSRQDALDAGVRWRVVECASGLRIEKGEPQDNRYDIEQVLRLVWLALENEREVRIEGMCRSDSAKKVALNSVFLNGEDDVSLLRRVR